MVSSGEPRFEEKPMASLRAFPVQIVYRADSLPELEARTGGPYQPATNECGSQPASLAALMRRQRYFQAFKELDMSEFDQDIALLTRIALFGAMVVLGFCVTPGF